MLFITKCHTKNSSQIPHLCRLVFWQYFFQSSPKIHDHRWGSEQRPIYKLKALRSLKAPVSSPRSNKAHAKVCLFYQHVYQSLCSDFRLSWIPPQGTWTSPPAAVYVRSLAENTGLSVLRDKLPQPFQSRFLFLRGRTQQKTDQMRGEDPVEKIHACSTNSSGKSKRLSRSCSSQQWHLKKRLACALTH